MIPVDTSAHTPGPWVVGSKWTKSGVYSPDGELVANTHSRFRNYDQEALRAEQDGNANLIAAAPDLLEALEPFAHYEKCRSAMGGNTPRRGAVFAVESSAGSAEITVEDFRAVLAAIAKARGA